MQTTKPIRAFHNDPKLKKDMVAEIKWHQTQDKIIQGTYGSNGKYCAVGCSINSLNRKLGKRFPTNDHSIYETQFGIPQTIAHLEDKIFEGMDSDVAKSFPLRFMESIKPGADLSLVTPKFMVWLLADEEDGVIQYADKQAKAVIQQVVGLYERVIAGGSVTDEEWDKAAQAAAEAVARAAAGAARDAARAARDAAYKKMADKLIELLAEAE